MLDPQERAKALTELKAQGKLSALVKSMTLDELVPIVKVLIDQELAPFVTRETVRPTWEHARRREYAVQDCENYFSKLPRAEKRKADMYPEVVIPLGSRDIVTADNNFDPLKSNGHRNICLLPSTGEIKEFAIWGHEPGDDEATKKPFDFWHQHRVMVEEKPFKFRSGEPGIGRDIAFIEESAPIDRTQVIPHLLSKAIPEFDAITQAYRYQPIIVRGKLMSFSSVEDWEPTGRLVEVRDKDGKPIRDDATGEILKREERKPSKEGQPVIQTRLDDTDNEILTFASTIVPMDKSEQSVNRLKLKFLNKKLAQQFIDLGPIQDQLFRDALAARDDPTEDTWEVLDGFLRGTEVVVVGVVTRFQKDPKGRALNWVDIEATMLLSLKRPTEGTNTVEQVVTTQAAPAAAPQPSPSPTVTPPKTEMVRPSGLEPTPIEEPRPVIEAVTAPQPEIIQPVQPVMAEPSIDDAVPSEAVLPTPIVQENLTPMQKLLRVIEEAVEVWQTYNIGIKEIQMVGSPLMKEFCVDGTNTIKDEFHDNVLLAVKNYVDAKKAEGIEPTPPPIASVAGPATGKKGESFEGVTFTKEPDTVPAPAQPENVDVPAKAGDGTRYVCPSCKEEMDHDDVFDHWNNCKGSSTG